MSTFRLAVERAMSGVGPFPRSIAESILEIAYLTMAVDEHLRDEEIEAFSVIAATMLQGRGGVSSEPLDDHALRTWLDRFGEDLTRDSFEPRLEAAVARLDGNHAAKLASYRVACLMAMSDLDAADREFEFDLQLIATLGIEQDEADTIMDEVNGALTPLDAN
jgi:hypothetical protein